jgi:hypothetical protein
LVVGFGAERRKIADGRLLLAVTIFPIIVIVFTRELIERHVPVGIDAGRLWLVHGLMQDILFIGD